MGDERVGESLLISLAQRWCNQVRAEIFSVGNLHPITFFWVVDPPLVDCHSSSLSDGCEMDNQLWQESLCLLGRAINVVTTQALARGAPQTLRRHTAQAFQRTLLSTTNRLFGDCEFFSEAGERAMF